MMESSEPEEGEICDSQKLKKRYGSRRKSDEDNLPLAYRIKRYNKKNISGVSKQSNSPNHSRQRSRESPQRHKFPRRSLSGSDRDNAKSRDSRDKSDGKRKRQSTTGSKRSVSRASRTSSDQVQSRPKSGGSRSSSQYSGSACISKRQSKRGKDSRNFGKVKKNDDLKSPTLKANDYVQRAKDMPDHDNFTATVEKSQTSRNSKDQPTRDIRLMEFSQPFGNGASALEDVDDISEDEVAVVTVLPANRNKPELIVLDSTSSSDEDPSANDPVPEPEVDPEPEPEFDLEELELRKQALEGLMRKLDPSDLNSSFEAATNPCSENGDYIITSCPVSPTSQLTVHGLNTSLSGLESTTSLSQHTITDSPASPDDIGISKPNSLEDIGISQPKRIPDDNDNENELELCLLRAKLLSDLKRKAKITQNSSSPSIGSASPTNIPAKKNRLVITNVEMGVAANNYLSREPQVRIPAVTHTSVPSLPTTSYTSRIDPLPVITGREHEHPSSYSYAPMPVDTKRSLATAPPQRSFAGFSISVSNDSDKRTVVSNASLSPPLPSTSTPPRQGRRVEIIESNQATFSGPNNYLNPDRIVVQTYIMDHQQKGPNSSPVPNQIEACNDTIKEKYLAMTTVRTRRPSADRRPLYSKEFQKAAALALQSSDSPLPTSTKSTTVTIKRTIVNPQAIKPIQYHRPTDNRRRPSKPAPPKFPPRKNIKPIVIPLRESDTSSDDESYRVASKSPTRNAPVELGDAFHSSLDTFLKTVRESATLNQARMAAITESIPAALQPYSNKSKVKNVLPVPVCEVTPAIQPSVAITEPIPAALQPYSDACVKKVLPTPAIEPSVAITESIPAALQPYSDARVKNVLPNPVCKVTAPIEPGVLTTDCNLRGTSNDKNPISSENTLPNSVNGNVNVNSESMINCIETEQQDKLKNQSPLFESKDENSTDSPTTNNFSSNEVQSSNLSETKLQEARNESTTAQSIVVEEESNSPITDSPIQNVVCHSDVNILDSPSGVLSSASVGSESPMSSKSVESRTSSRNNSGVTKDKEQGSTSPKVPQVKVVNKAQTRQELQLREKLLWITLQNSERKLKLTSTEKQLIVTRQSASELLGKLLEKVVKYSDKEKQCSDLEKQAQRIKRQLEMVERNLHVAKIERSTLQEDYLKSAGEAFSMRKKSVDLGKECQMIGKQIRGDAYRVPTHGSTEMLTKMKEIHIHSTAIKKLKANSSALMEIDNQVEAALNSGSKQRPPVNGRKTGPNASSQPNQPSGHENWNQFKSNGLTKCLRNSDKATSALPMKIKDVMQASSVPLGSFVPYSSPISYLGVHLKIMVQNKEPICIDSITRSCRSNNCKLQHVIL